MAAATELNFYKDALIVLATAGIVVPLMHRLKVSPVLGYLAAGALLGPKGLGLLAQAFPSISWLVISNEADISGMAELGVVFLLFVIGLELSLPRLMTMRRLVFGLGGLQVLMTWIVIAALAPLFGNSAAASLLIGASLALSSTAIVVEQLAREQRLTTAAGRATFSVLLAQDLAVVPILMLVGVLSAKGHTSLTTGLVIALVQAVVAVAVIIGFGRLVLQPLFRMAAATDSPELFMALTMLVAIGTGVVTAGAGLSMALGAFVAGLLLAETEYRKAIEATIEPFKGLLLGVFFISVGMKLDLAVLARNPFYFVACAAGLIVLKAAITAPLARLFSLSWPAAIETALLIGPGGEFAFIVVGLAMSAGLIAPANGTALLTVVTLTMVAIPGAARLGTHLSGRIAKNAQPEDHAALEPTGDVKTRALVVGCGRVGRLVSDMLATHNVAHVLTDRDPAAVTQARKLGREAYFGDAKGARFLERCGLNEAEAVILTINARSEVDEIVAVVRAVRPKIVIVARAKDAKHASHLYKLGVTDAVPETIEASLQLSEAALVGLGAPTELVIASIHEKRDEFRHELQKASGEAARPIRGIRAARDNRKRKG